MRKPKKLALVAVNLVTEGTVIYCDNCFTCMPPWAIKTVKMDSDKDFYIECDYGKHHLEGQRSGTDQRSYSGFWLEKEVMEEWKDWAEATGFKGFYEEEPN